MRLRMAERLGVWFPAVRAGSGADVFTERLCAGLNARGIKAGITWLPLRAEYAPWSVPVPQPPAWATLAHVNSWLHPRFLPRELPVVGTIHHCMHDPAMRPYKNLTQNLYHQFWIRHVEAANLRRSIRVAAVSHYAAQAAQVAFGKAEITVIPNGVDTTFFTPLHRDSPHRPFRLLYVGNWNRLKGVDLLAPIMQALGPGFELFYTTGRGGNQRSFLIPPNSHPLGLLDQTALCDAYRQADALLFPSRLEGFGLVVAEAMACGLPVIVADSSALPELVVHGRTGLLCPVDDVGAFAAAARRLAHGTSLWQAMRQEARQRAVELFDESKQITRWLDLYQSLAETGRYFS